MTKIEWTEQTLNVITGCTPISEGCKNCYAKTLSKRLKAMGKYKYRNEFDVTLHPNEISKIDSWKKPCKTFLNSMSDTFHKDVYDQFIKELFGIMSVFPEHTFQILTKRSDRLKELSSKLIWSKNIWMGVSVELAKYYNRIDDLRSTKAAIKFLSLEPLLGPMPNLNLEGIDWVIVGGESGPKSKIRKMELDWAWDIRDQCVDQGVKFFYKQGGTLNPCDKEELTASLENRGMFFLDINVKKLNHDICSSKGCRFLDGICWEEMP